MAVPSSSLSFTYITNVVFHSNSSFLTTRPRISSQKKSISSKPSSPLAIRTSLRPNPFSMNSNGCNQNSSMREVLVRSSSSDSPKTAAPALGLSTVVGILHLVVSLGTVLAADYFLKRAFAAAAIKFPSALFGMFCTFSVLMVLDSFVPPAAMGLVGFFEPATLFIQRWLPLFYVPSLVVLPLTVKDVPAASGLKIFFILETSYRNASIASFSVD